MVVILWVFLRLFDSLKLGILFVEVNILLVKSFELFVGVEWVVEGEKKLYIYVDYRCVFWLKYIWCNLVWV